jgi:hydroxymethylpyrimidine pyrophosphatase-like HAD family hydrolase
MSSAKYDTFATDYDGTLAHDGRVDDSTLRALERARAAGIRLLMVTGRQLTDLSNTFPHLGLFDRVVAENGAVLFTPEASTLRVIAPPPPPTLVDWLSARNIPVWVGHSIIATVEPHEHEVLAGIHELGLEWHIIFNKGSVMVLPSGVTKATGLGPALEDLQATAERTVGIGDAENDQAFLSACGLAVAVANALPAVKEMADLVTTGARGAGVTEVLDAMIEGTLDAVPIKSKGLSS